MAKIYYKITDEKDLFHDDEGIIYRNDGNGNMKLWGVLDTEPTTNVFDTQRSFGYYWINMYDTEDWMIFFWDGEDWIDCELEEINFIDEVQITRGSDWAIHLLCVLNRHSVF